MLPQVATKYKIPGLVVAVIQNGRVAGIESFGVRDKKSNATITENTVFEAGSLSEPVFAYAVLNLVADGRLDLGTPLTKYLPPPYIRDVDPLSPSSPTEPLYDPRFNQVSVFRVLNHTSGMPDWARGEHLRLNSMPGEKWSYSNEGYLYLQHAVEHVTGEPAAVLLTRYALRPTGMGHSSFVWREEYASQAATGHDGSGIALEMHHYLRPAAATTLYTTIDDYAHFVTAMLTSAPAQRAHESAVSLMLNPTVAVDDSLSFSWGLGCGLEKTSDDLFFFHRGAAPGFRSFFIASRKTGKGVVILTNSEHGLDAVEEIVTATIGGGNHPIFKSAFLHSP